MTEFEQRIASVRQFNRFYTQRIGVLAEGLLESQFSLSEARVLYELAHREKPVSSELAQDLGLDSGYLSRILRNFESRGMLEREPSQSDGRHRLLSLTTYGREVFAPLDACSREAIGALLHELPKSDQERLVEAMRAIESILGRPRRTAAAYLLREPLAGDLGWVVQRHGAIYAEEYGWNEEFEALVAEVVASFIRNSMLSGSAVGLRKEITRTSVRFSSCAHRTQWPSFGFCWSSHRRADSVLVAARWRNASDSRNSVATKG
jgi:DNA-binding MarR family transcriptional regulator